MYCDRLVIRRTARRDLDTIASVIIQAFGREQEARIAGDLITGRQWTLSLLAERDGLAVGHILLSEIDGPIRVATLAPLAVIPQARELQVGSNLVRNAIKMARKAGFKAVFVLGNPTYFERFGFKASDAPGFQAPWHDPNLMALPLTENVLPVKAAK